MKIYKCDIDGIHEIECEEYIELPRIDINDNDIVIYSDDEEEARLLYKEKASEVITRYLNKMIRLQHSINNL